MGFFAAFLPLWYAFLSMVGVALSGIVLAAHSSGAKGVDEGIFIFTSVCLSLSIASFVLSTVSMYFACKADSSESEAVKLTSDARDAGVKLGVFVLGSLLLALSAIVVSLGTAIPVSSFHYAIAVLSMSSLSVTISLGKGVAACVSACKARVAN